MQATNDGKYITVKACFTDAALIVMALEKAIIGYERDGSTEVSEELEDLLYTLKNPEVMRTK